MIKTNKIPEADIAVIGGSGTFATDFPRLDASPDVEIFAQDLVFSTPYGPSPPFSLFSLGPGKRVLACRMHGWRPGTSRRAASQQIFWSFARAGVSRVIAEGGVGTIRTDYLPGDVFIPLDYIDWSCRRDTALSDDYLLVMRDPLCHSLRHALLTTAKSHLPPDRVHDRGVYAVTDGRHFESRAEVKALAGMGADVIGQSLAPEVYLAREIGACYAGIHQIVNRAEGVGEDWSHEELSDIFHNRASFMSRLLLETLFALPPPKECVCHSLRKKTLLTADPPVGP
jgi:5'-methylthioadenosine phosphorylase